MRKNPVVARQVVPTEISSYPFSREHTDIYQNSCVVRKGQTFRVLLTTGSVLTLIAGYLKYDSAQNGGSLGQGKIVLTQVV